LDKILIRGGVPLSGTVRVSGSKNGALAIMAACLLANGRTMLRNVPDIGDIATMAEMLSCLGAEVNLYPDGTMSIDAGRFSAIEAPEELVRKMRASFYVLGPMLARLGAARVALPGGCDIGARPVDYHTRGLQALGARVKIDHGFVEAHTRELLGAPIYLDFPSAGATTHLMTAASLARGTTTIENAACEPEVVDLANFLRAMGAKIEGAGTKKILIEGVPELKGADYTIIPDRIEAGTYAVIAAITGGDLVIDGIIPDHLTPVFLKLQEAGVAVVPVAEHPEAVGLARVTAVRRPRAVDILAMPHPGFPTDLQQPMVALLSLASGTSVVTDQVFESRFKYLSELQRLGADVRVEGRSAIVRGVKHLSGAAVTATDLRAGAALLAAGLAAEGETFLSGIHHLDRGYGAVVKKLARVGADIVRFNAERPAQMLSVV
jgi:UDP-N-acetylglucosamine 1-carboxyvinyltransferase